MSVTNPRHEKLDHAADEVRRHLRTLPPLPAGVRPMGLGTHGEEPAHVAVIEGLDVAVMPASKPGDWYVTVQDHPNHMDPHGNYVIGEVACRAWGVPNEHLANVVERCLRATVAARDAMRDALTEPVCAHGCDPEAGRTCAEDCDAGPREQAAESDEEERRRLA